MKQPMCFSIGLKAAREPRVALKGVDRPLNPSFTPERAAGKSFDDHDGQLQEPAKVRVDLCGVSRSLVVPLMARACDAVASHPILGDPYAQNTLQKLVFDRDAMITTPSESASMALRTRHFDQWATVFLQKYLCATVVHLACGLDSRMQRANWTESTRWIDIDLPEGIELRRQVLPSHMSDQDYSLMGADILDRTWMQDIPTDRPILIVMEGFLSYLVEDEVQSLLLQFCEKLGQGEMGFECIKGSLKRQSSLWVKPGL